jgi:Arc/MetJ-type ribon-helix-helix transcriptional regulator
MAIVTISISEDLAAFLRGRVQEGGFRDLDEYLQSVLRQIQANEIGFAGNVKGDLNASGNKKPWEIALAIGSSVPNDEWSKVPTDLSKNLDHYLYGSPREE